MNVIYSLMTSLRDKKVNSKGLTVALEQSSDGLEAPWPKPSGLASKVGCSPWKVPKTPSSIIKHDKSVIIMKFS